MPYLFNQPDQPSRRTSEPTTSYSQSQHSLFAKSAVLSSMSRSASVQLDPASLASSIQGYLIPSDTGPGIPTPYHHTKTAPFSSVEELVIGAKLALKPKPYFSHDGRGLIFNVRDGVGIANSDTPISTAPSSPKMPAMKNTSGGSTPRIRPTTLDIPGLTKSKVSPDGRIAQRDIGSKLVIVMVGLPARGKSYITKKLARYLNWLQHDTRIFNVGERRRVVAGVRGGRPGLSRNNSYQNAEFNGLESSQATFQHHHTFQDQPNAGARIQLNGREVDELTPLDLPSPYENQLDPLIIPSAPQEMLQDQEMFGTDENGEDPETMDQSASFFDPDNKKAAMIREQIAKDTLGELLDYILLDGGSVGILDATNSTLSRRQMVMQYVRERAGPELNVLFVESVCKDETLLESNMRLKLSGPDYKDKDPIIALEDFRKRVAIYEKKYVPLGDYEEKNNMPYIQMVDVGRKVISHQIKGFLSAQAAYYLLNFNLAPRTIWITRHGESIDNVKGQIGGDSDLSRSGQHYARALSKFIEVERKGWELRQRDKAAHTHFPPHPGDHTPPNPHYGSEDTDLEPRNFCVWTSMLKRSVQSADYFNDDVYEVKQMRMLNELYAGIMEGMTYDEIKMRFSEEYQRRRADKLSYRYPGPGGEGYLDVINRLRQVIVELERMTDHCLLITHRSVARVLLAYFLGLRRDEVADLDCPLGMVYMLEPKPYGVEFKAYSYNPLKDWFDYLPDYKLQREKHP